MKPSYFSKLILPVVIFLGCNVSALAQTLFPVPNVPGCRGVSGVIVNMRGGQGGSTNGGGTPGATGAVGVGGYGGSVVCTLDVQTPTVITSLTYYTGMAGAAGLFVPTGTTGAFGGTGFGTGGNGGNFAGPTGSVGNDLSGGGGGGSSAVLNTTGSVVLMVAAGGGGGGTQAANTNGGFGGNPGTPGQGYAPYNYGGAGGTAGAGGAGGTGLNNNGIAAGAVPPGNGGNGGLGLTGSQSGGGGGAGWGGGGGGGAGNTGGTGTLSGVNTPSAAGGGGCNYVNPSTVTTGLVNGTANVTGNGAVTLTLYPAAIGGTCISICEGATTTFTETTPGGVWSSSNNAIATVSSTTGSSITVTAGTTVGTANISYTVAGGYYAFVAVTVLAAPSPISGPTNVCQGATIPLSNAVTGGVWSTANTTVATVVANTGVVTGVSAGNAVITYTSPGGCPAFYTIAVTTQPNPITGGAVCAGGTILLTDTPPGGEWTSSNTSVATIDPVTGLGTGVSAGTTTITYSFNSSCYTTTVVTVNPLPVITSVDPVNPLTCGGLGSIILNGLTPGAYTVDYYYNGVPAATITATASPLTIPGLDTGSYTYINVTNVATGCSSDSVATSLTGPPTPPPPVLSSNQPLCEFQTLFLKATDAMPGGTYAWTGPNSFTSSIQDPSIVRATQVNVGTYTAIYTLANCVSLPSTTDVTMYALSLVNVTPDQVIPYGSTVQLSADNAIYYRWTPDNGSISNPNINNPIVAPLVTTTYTVYGMDQNGCLDSAMVTVTVDSSMNTGIPSAFTPNGDGVNDVFRPVGVKYQRLVDFRVYNRWGQQVFYSNNIEKGWDGTSNGVPQDVGVYYYQVIVADPGGMGKNNSYKGDVTLVR